MALTQTLTSVSATTHTNIYTAAGDVSCHVRICNDNATSTLIRMSQSTTTAAQQASGKLVPDDYEIAARSWAEFTGICLNTTNEFLVLYSSNAVNAIVSATSI